MMKRELSTSDPDNKKSCSKKQQKFQHDSTSHHTQKSTDGQALGDPIKTLGSGRNERATQQMIPKPTSPKLDFVISIYSRHVNDMLSGAKDHEFRTYPLPAGNMWIYETAPISAVRYLAVISAPERPADMNHSNLDIENNRKFAAGEPMLPGSEARWYAHQIVEMYRLPRPVTLQDLKDQGILRGAPQKYAWLSAEAVRLLSVGLERVPLPTTR